MVDNYEYSIGVKKLKLEYIKKLENIEKKDKRVHFRTIEEFDRHFGLIA